MMGTDKRPRLVVFRSQKHIYAQLIDDISGIVIAQCGSLSLKDLQKDSSKKEMACEVGKGIAQTALKKDIQKVVFDRNGFIYHGRVKALASGARKAGLLF